MDKTETYIRMCDHPAIRKHRIECYEDGDFVAEVGGAVSVSQGDVSLTAEIWLPRLDQWVELIEGQITLRRFESGGCEVIRYFRCFIAQRETAEQAACLAYMAQQGFKWTDSGWEATN